MARRITELIATINMYIYLQDVNARLKRHWKERIKVDIRNVYTKYYFENRLKYNIVLFSIINHLYLAQEYSSLTKSC